MTKKLYERNQGSKSKDTKVISLVVVVVAVRTGRRNLQTPGAEAQKNSCRLGVLIGVGSVNGSAAPLKR